MASSRSWDRAGKPIEFSQVDLEKARADAVADEPALGDVSAQRPRAHVGVCGGRCQADQPSWRDVAEFVALGSLDACSVGCLLRGLRGATWLAHRMGYTSVLSGSAAAARPLMCWSEA